MLEALSKSLPVDVAHDEILPAGVGTAVDHRHAVPAGHGACRPRLMLETMLVYSGTR